MQYLVNISSFILLLTFAINVGLGAFVYFRDKRSRVNRSFAAFLFCIAIWTLSFLLFQNTKNPHWVLFTRRLTPVGSSLIAGYFLFFSLLFPRTKQDLSLPVKLVVLLPGFVFSLLSLFTDWMIKAVVITNPHFLFLGKVVFGPAYRLFSIYFISYFTLGLLNIFVKYFRSQGQEKLQMFYVVFGVTISGVVGIAISLILPMLGVSGLFTSGPPFTLFLAGFVSYAMVKHKLLDIDDFLSRGVIVLAATAMAVGTLAILLQGQFDFLLPFYAISCNFGLGLFVLLRGWHDPVNRNFGILAALIALWALFVYLSNATPVYADALFWNRMIYVVTSIIPVFSLSFSFYFPYVLNRVGVFVFHFSLALAFFFAFSSFFTNWLIKGLYFVPGGSKIVFGFLHPFFAFYIIVYLGFTFFHLITKYFRARGVHRIQILYFFFGSFVSSILAVITNVLLPLIGNSAYTGLGPSFMLILVGFVSYAIVKHRLMSIEIVVQRSSVYAFATVLIMSLYALAVIISETFLRNIMGYTSLLVTAATALVIAIVYQPLVGFLQNLSDRLFFRGRYDYQRTLREISQKIASVIRLEELSSLVVSTFVETMKVSDISFLLLDRDQEHFRSVSLSLPRYKKIEIDISSPVVSWIIKHKDTLVREEIEDAIYQLEALGKEGTLALPALLDVRDEMERLGITIWVPIISKDKLIGIIALGHKLSGDVFTSEDFGLLGTLASQTAVALDNARLYDEVVNMKDYNEEILQSMVSGVLTVDTRGRVVTYNQMAERICGRKMADVLGKTCEDLWGKRGAITQVIESSLKERCCLNFEASIASPEKGLVPVALSSTLLWDHQGKRLGVLLTIEDLTEVKELENKVRQADKLSALATMAAGMAHEIKNPLSSMKVLSQLLPLKFQDPEYRQKLEEILPREINRIDRIVESLLGFARATAPQYEKLDVHEVIEENVKYFREQAKAADVELVTSYAELPAIEADRGQISQVFSNLILNAIQAMPSGGKVEIKTMPGKKIENILESVKIQVKDGGYGISEDKIKKLFDPFFTTKYGGTGLGLTITHSIVDGHRGAIDVESKVGQGTTFTVTLPVKQGLL